MAVRFLGALRALLQLDTGSFNASLEKSANKLDSTRSRMNRTLAGLERGFTSMSRQTQRFTGGLFSLQGALGAVLGGTSAMALARNALNTADAIAKMADRAGVGVRAFQELKYAADLADVSNEQLERGLSELNKRMGIAASGGKNPFAQFGIDIRDASGAMRSADAVFEDIAARFAGTSDAAARANLTFQTMGKSGVQMGALLKGGADGIRAAREEAERLGLVLDEQTIRSAEQFNDQMNSLGQVIQTNFNAGFLDGFLKDARDMRDVFGDPELKKNVEAVGESLGSTMRYMVENADTILKIGAILGGAVVGARIGRIGGGFGAAAGMVIGAGAAAIETTRPDNVRIPGGPSTPVPANIEENLTRPTQAATEATEDLSQAVQDYNAAESARKQTMREVEEIFSRTRTSGEQYEATVTRLGELLKSGALDGYGGFETYERGVANARDELEKADEALKRSNDAAKELGLTFSSSFENAMRAGAGLRETLKGIADDIYGIFLRKQVTEPLGNALSSALGPGLSSFFGGGTTGVDSSLPWAKAGGGPVSAGELYRVNEHGTEYFQPSMGGKVVPLSASGGPAGNTYVIDARGTDASVVRRLEMALMQLAGPGVIEHRVADAQRRGAI
jgi:hypothetical protein